MFTFFLRKGGGGLVQKVICQHAIFGAVFQKGQLRPYYGVSHWRVGNDETGEIGPSIVAIIHGFQSNWHTRMVRP